MSLEDELLKQRCARIQEIESLGYRAYGKRYDFTHSIPQVLRLMNAREHADMNGPTQSYINGKQPPEAIEHLYLAVLARRPTVEEKDELVQYVAGQSNPRQGMADVFWVLLNSAEFLVNH